MSAYERLGWLPATTTKQRRAEVEKALLKAAPTRVPAATAGSRDAPRHRRERRSRVGSADVYSVRESPGRARGGLATVDVQTGTESAAQAIPSWPAAVTNVDGTFRWLGLYDPCDGVCAARPLGPPERAAVRDSCRVRLPRA